MLAEEVVASHEHVDVCNSPLSESVFAEPLHQRFVFVLALEELWCLHLVLEEHQMLKCVYLLTNWKFGYDKSDRRLD